VVGEIEPTERQAISRGDLISTDADEHSIAHKRWAARILASTPVLGRRRRSTSVGSIAIAFGTGRVSASAACDESILFADRGTGLSGCHSLLPRSAPAKRWPARAIRSANATHLPAKSTRPGPTAVDPSLAYPIELMRAGIGRDGYSGEHLLHSNGLIAVNVR
jgi:hypothetical protein